MSDGLMTMTLLPGTWASFTPWAILSSLCWVGGLWQLYRGQSQKLGWGLVILGIALQAVWVGCLWHTLERPPLRTLGETRTWYSTLIPLVGVIVSMRWKIRWPVVYCTAMGMLFMAITATHPESFDKALMPALQSYWFVPHVVVYIVSYAFLSAASLFGASALWQAYQSKRQTGHAVWSLQTLVVADNTVQIGFSFLTLGLLFGALWAKEAWGHYWTWDPKETWAFLTWAAFLAYIHIRRYHATQAALAFRFLVGALVVLLLCWFGVNYMPSAQYSVHTYTKG